MTIYDIKVVDNKGNEKTLEEYKGLEKLYLKYKEEGLVILDFPCNQFLHQAPGSDEEINTFCEMRYKTTFPRFKKIDELEPHTLLFVSKALFLFSVIFLK